METDRAMNLLGSAAGGVLVFNQEFMDACNMAVQALSAQKPKEPGPATVTVVLEDSIYRRAAEMMTSEHTTLEAFIQAAIEGMVMMMATGQIPQMNQESLEATKKIADRARRLASQSGQ